MKRPMTAFVQKKSKPEKPPLHGCFSRPLAPYGTNRIAIGQKTQEIRSVWLYFCRRTALGSPRDSRADSGTHLKNPRMRNVLRIVFLINLAVTTLWAQQEPVEITYGPYNGLPRQDQAMQKWRANRFGQFIHWGLYAIPGGIWDGKTYNYASEFLMQSADIPETTWQELRHKFTLEKYDPWEWAALAKEMGVKYVTLTTKHHEGFCLWPSRFTDYDIESTPYKKDVLGEFVKAYTAQGIDVNFYYSVLDWHHPDWRYDTKTEKDSLAFDRYKEFVRDQLTELLERYPQVKGLWFDGTWDASWKKNGRFSYELEKYLKEIHPGLIVNSRMRADEYGSRHFDSNGHLMGDYESGYERRLPDLCDIEVLTRDWECCMTIPENQWGYHKDWTLSHVKSSEELLEMLVQVVSQNGNFLLNFGPMGNGDIRPEERKIAAEIGSWMEKNGTAIYNCGPAFLPNQGWGFYTKNQTNGSVNMVVFNRPVSGRYRVKVDKGTYLEKAYWPHDPSKTIEVEPIDNTSYFLTPKNTQGTDPFVLTLEIKEGDSGLFYQKVLK